MNYAPAWDLFNMLCRKIVFVLTKCLSSLVIQQRAIFKATIFQISRRDARSECMTLRYPASAFLICIVNLGKNLKKCVEPIQSERHFRIIAEYDKYHGSTSMVASSKRQLLLIE